MKHEIIQGSLGQIARDSNHSIAETFVSADAIVLCDTSGSMNTPDAPGGVSRYDALLKELRILQSIMPGKIAVIAFSSITPVFCPDGVPAMMGGGTDVTGALKFAKIADIPGAMKFIVISDGQMDNEISAIETARTFNNSISVIYVGPESDPTGRDALQQLAKASGGQSITADRTQGLALSTQKLLMAA
jgi:Mg-chelatase subunit ChlD